jgi:multiple PDZ domain protein
LLEVNSVSLRAVCHEAAISTLRRTPAKVRILIYRDENLLLSLLDPTQIYNTLEIELVKKPGRGLGISIVGRTNEPGVYISEIVRGGVAEFDGRSVVSMNRIPLSNFDFRKARSILQGNLISLKIIHF